MSDNEYHLHAYLAQILLIQNWLFIRPSNVVFLTAFLVLTNEYMNISQAPSQLVPPG